MKNIFLTNQIIKESNNEKWIIIYCWKITFLEILLFFVIQSIIHHQSIFVIEFDYRKLLEILTKISIILCKA